MCNKMYENVKSLDYTKKSLQSDSDPATMEVAQMLAISQRAAYNLCNSTTEFRVLRAGGSIRIPKDSFDAWLYRAA